MKANYYIYVREGYIEFFTTLEEAKKAAKKYGVKVHKSEHSKTIKK